MRVRVLFLTVCATILCDSDCKDIIVRVFTGKGWFV
jgi:hypothetical protein